LVEIQRAVVALSVLITYRQRAQPARPQFVDSGKSAWEGFMLVPILAIMLAFAAVLIVVRGMQARREAQKMRAELTDPAQIKLINLNGRGALMTGIVLLFPLIGCGGPFLLSHLNQTAFIENNQSITSITPAMEGEQVLVEGRVSDGIKDGTYGLFAYKKYNQTSTSGRFDHEYIAPFVIRVAGQSIPIEDQSDPEDADYDLEAQRRFSGSANVYGLRIQDPVMAVGVVRREGASTYVDADLVFGGSRLDYLNSSHAYPLIVPALIGATTAVMTCGLLLYGFASGAAGDMWGKRKGR
jgi:hypothetical protein